MGIAEGTRRAIESKLGHGRAMSITCYLQWSWQTTSRPLWGFRILRSQEGRNLCVYFVAIAILILRTMAHSRHSVNTMLPKRKLSPER